MAKVYDVIIIGSGPSGYTAAIYAARANLSVLMFQGYETGGQLMQTTDVENYPGFEEGILGPDMMEKFEAQARRFGTEMLTEELVAFRSVVTREANAGWDRGSGSEGGSYQNARRDLSWRKCMM